jgi:hypothetical protein
MTMLALSDRQYDQVMTAANLLPPGTRRDLFLRSTYNRLRDCGSAPTDFDVAAAIRMVLSVSGIAIAAPSRHRAANRAS